MYIYILIIFYILHIVRNIPVILYKQYITYIMYT